MKVKLYKTNKIRRQVRTRSKINGTSSCPRLSVFRSNKFIYGQLIDDVKGLTLVSCSDKALKLKSKNKVEAAFEVGKKLSGKAVEKGIKHAVFDRGSYKYHGRVKSLADGAREGGLKF